MSAVPGRTAGRRRREQGSRAGGTIIPKQPRLLIVTDSPFGGLGATVFEQSRWFQGRGWQVMVATPRPHPPDSHAAVVEFPLPSTARGLSGVLKAAKALRRVESGWRPDIVHANGARSALVALACLRTRPFVTLHGTGSVESDPRGWPILRRLGLVALPMLTRRAWTVGPLSLRLWSFQPYASPRLSELRELALPERATFAWIGGLNQAKLPEVFVQAIAALAPIGVRGVMAGTGPRSEEIKQLVARTKAPIEMAGQLDDLEPLLAESTAVALFSRFEAVPFALQEAMWAGRQVVATPHAGIRWLCGDGGRYATTVDEAIWHLRSLTDRHVAEREGRQAAQRVRQKLAPACQWISIEQAFLSELGIPARADSR